MEALRKQNNNGIRRSARAQARIVVCAARRRWRRQPRKRLWRSTGSQRRSRARTSVQTCLRARPRCLRRMVHLASRSSSRTTSKVRSTDRRTRVLGGCLVARLGSPALPCLGSLAIVGWFVRIIIIAHSQPLPRFGVSVRGFAFAERVRRNGSLAQRSELVNRLKLPKFPARDLRRALEQAASVRASNRRESTVSALPQKAVEYS